MIPNRPENATAPAAAPAADAWLTPWRFALVLTSLIVVSFPRVLAGSETFFYRDYANFGYPIAFYAREALRHGQLPLWNPLNNCGLPFLAQWNPLTLYPLSLFYVLLPMPWSLGVFCLLHLFLGGMGMYFLARRWTGNQLAAAIAGVVFAFNGLTWHSLMWPNNNAALGWLPWVVFAAQLAWREGGHWIVLAAFAGAMQMLTGAPEIILQTWCFVGVWWLLEFFCARVGNKAISETGDETNQSSTSGRANLDNTTEHPSSPSPREARAGRGLGRGESQKLPIQHWVAPLPNPLPTPPSWGEGTASLSFIVAVSRGTTRGRMLGRFISVPVLVALLAAAQLLPFLDLLAHSQRDNSFGDSQWAMPASGLANYLEPLFHFCRAAQGVFEQVGQYWTSSYYLGVSTIALALLAAWRVRRREVWLLLLLAVFSMVMAMGEHGFVYAWLKQLAPQIGFMRFPIKFIVLATFVIPLLAAYAVAWFQALPVEQWLLERAKLPLLGLAPLTLLTLISWFALRHPQPLDVVPVTLANAAVRAIFLTAILGCLWALRAPTQILPQRLLQICLVSLFWFDVLTHAPTLSPTVEPSVYQPDMIRLYNHWDTQLRPGESRAMATPAAELKMMFGAVPKAADVVNGQRITLFADQNLLDHVAKVDGFYSLYPREANDLNVYLYTLTNGLSPLKDFLGVAMISNPTNALDWTARDSFMPLITVGQEPRFADGPTAFRGVVDDGFDPRRWVYLPTEAQSAITAIRRPEAKVISRQFSAQRIDADVETPAPALVVVAQSYYHNWRAYVDERPVHLWEANYAFQALEVPTGRHQVSLVYEDWAFWGGAALSLTTLVACVITCLPRKATKVFGNKV